MTEDSARKRKAFRDSLTQNEADEFSKDGAREPRKDAPPSPAPCGGTTAAWKPPGGSEHDSLADASYGVGDAAGPGSRASKPAKRDAGDGEGAVGGAGAVADALSRGPVRPRRRRGGRRRALPRTVWFR